MVEIDVTQIRPAVQINQMAHDHLAYRRTKDLLLCRIDGIGLYDLAVVDLNDHDGLPGRKRCFLGQETGELYGARIGVDGETVSLHQLELRSNDKTCIPSQ
ncbi:hypothetical protein SDC9_95740 [bioreactor metagenome]|uniref:Uncharacterized protein n=1 Tax=bioreactor metagenome TaxID=1076179 RepID=A0A645A7C2_9ZZZZ